MSTDKKPAVRDNGCECSKFFKAGVDNTFRKTWDRAAALKKAEERAQRELEGEQEHKSTQHVYELLFAIEISSDKVAADCIRDSIGCNSV
jgi:hypothetical protein